MTVPTLFDSWRPIPEVLAGEGAETEFAADLAQVIVGGRTDDPVGPVRFLADTSRCLRDLPGRVCGPLRGAGGESASNPRLDTSHGGGRPHGLIVFDRTVSLRAPRRRFAGYRGVCRSRASARGRSCIATLDGEGADSANGHRMDGATPVQAGGRDRLRVEWKGRLRRMEDLASMPGFRTLAPVRSIGKQGSHVAGERSIMVGDSDARQASPAYVDCVQMPVDCAREATGEA